ncbi:MAG: ATP-binding protein [Caldisericia bacterium]|nr:ATP-binding protein [Caldisericia bacterium]
MLLEFLVENFRSFKNEVVLSMVASYDKTSESDNVVKLCNGTRVLKSAAIYGYNATGKSNLIKALNVFLSYILTSQDNNENEEQKRNILPFLFNTETIDKPSTFQIVFVHEAIQYRYGISMDQKRIHSEWLYASYSSRESKLFSRNKDEIVIGRKFPEGKKLAKNTRKDVPFLSVVSYLNGETSSKIFNWIKNVQIDPSRNIHPTSKLLLDESKNRPEQLAVRRMIELADLKISTIEVKEENVPYAILDFIINNKNNTKRVIENDLIEGHEDNPSIPKTRMGHKVFDKDSVKPTSTSYLDLTEESQGTKRIYSLIGPILLSLKNGTLMVIDEIERSLHPELMKQIIAMYQSKKTNPNHAQLIFTTHDTTILRDKNLRRDQIWFLDKDHQGSSILFSLFDFSEHVRKDASWEKDYLDGRYTMSPKIKNLAQNLYK